jgi:uncharacterized protein DUF5320
MAGRDKTGPMGNGPMTGRQGGNCKDAVMSGTGNKRRQNLNRNGNKRCGIGLGLRRRWGQIMGNMDQDVMDPEYIDHETKTLLQKTQELEASFEQINKRLLQLEKSDE